MLDQQIKKKIAGGSFYSQVKANSTTQAKAGLKDTAEIKNTDAEEEDASADINSAALLTERV